MSRRYVPVRISGDGYKTLADLAKQETGGNVSEMIRKLLAEALTARATRHRRA